MPLFAYTAVDPSGRTVKATIEADDERLVIAKLREQSLTCTEIRKASKSGVKSFGKKKFKPKSLVVFSRQFATMIDAGIPILRCLEILTGQTKDPGLKEALEAVSQDVKGGAQLNDALAKHPRIFNKLYVNMIRAAELGWIRSSTACPASSSTKPRSRARSRAR
jgi:type IV pilus assembly protein PilC